MYTSRVILSKLKEPKVFCKKGDFSKKNHNSKEDICARISFLIKSQYLWKETEFQATEFKWTERPLKLNFKSLLVIESIIITHRHAHTHTDTDTDTDTDTHIFLYACLPLISYSKVMGTKHISNYCLNSNKFSM